MWSANMPHRGQPLFLQAPARPPGRRPPAARRRHAHTRAPAPFTARRKTRLLLIASGERKRERRDEPRCSRALERLACKEGSISGAKGMAGNVWVGRRSKAGGITRECGGTAGRGTVLVVRRGRVSVRQEGRGEGRRPSVASVERGRGRGAGPGASPGGRARGRMAGGRGLKSQTST